MMDDIWYYCHDGRQGGPIAWAELCNLAGTGQIAADDLVWQAGTPDWVPARTVAGLLPAVQSPPQLPPTAPPPAAPVARPEPARPFEVATSAGGPEGLPQKVVAWLAAVVRRIGSDLAPLVGGGTAVRTVTAERGVVVAPDAVFVRPDQAIWHGTEPEGRIPAGYRRPLLILDEETVHLAHTDRHLDPDELHRRIRDKIDRQNVPVATELRPVSWQSDPGESRKRVLASLRDHVFSDIKILMGVDYLGAWAGLQLQVGVEPPPVPVVPAMKLRLMPGFWFALLAALLFFIAALVCLEKRWGLAAAASGMLCFLSVLLAFLYFLAAYLKAQREQNLAVLRKAAHEARELAKALRRTFKIDDIRLFSSAMRKVYQEVVDDLVSQGATVVRVEGGRGGFLKTDSSPASSPSPAMSDAAEAEV